MVGHVPDEAKSRLFESTDVLVLPSYTENFGMVVAEALAHSVPVIASRNTPWARMQEIGCGLWIDNDPEELGKAIEQISEMKRSEMGQRGRDWMKRDFGWGSIAEKMCQLYTDLVAATR